MEGDGLEKGPIDMVNIKSQNLFLITIIICSKVVRYCSTGSTVRSRGGPSQAIRRL